jgi:hypothetical protein
MAGTACKYATICRPVGRLENWKVLTPNFALVIQKASKSSLTKQTVRVGRWEGLCFCVSYKRQPSFRVVRNEVHCTPQLGFVWVLKEQTDKTAWIRLDWVAFSFSAMLGWQKEVQNRLGQSSEGARRIFKGTVSRYKIYWLFLKGRSGTFDTDHKDCAAHVCTFSSSAANLWESYGSHVY